MLSDLRESGSIEQDADQVMFIYRPEYYKLDTFPDDGSPALNRAEIMIEKNRHGSTSSIKVRFEKQYTKFCDDIDYQLTADSQAGITPNMEEHAGFVTVESNASDDSEMPF